MYAPTRHATSDSMKKATLKLTFAHIQASDLMYATSLAANQLSSRKAT